MKTILTSQKRKRLWNDLMSPDSTKPDIFPIKGNTRYSCFLRNVNMTGFYLCNLFINLEMHLLMNLLYLLIKFFNLKVKLGHSSDQAKTTM